MRIVALGNIHSFREKSGDCVHVLKFRKWRELFMFNISVRDTCFENPGSPGTQQSTDRNKSSTWGNHHPSGMNFICNSKAWVSKLCRAKTQLERLWLKRQTVCTDYAKHAAPCLGERCSVKTQSIFPFSSYTRPMNTPCSWWPRSPLTRLRHLRSCAMSRPPTSCSWCRTVHGRNWLHGKLSNWAAAPCS